MKVYIDKHEWYPVYVLIDDPKRCEYYRDVELNCEIPQELFNEWKMNLDKFHAIQKRIEKYYEDQS